MTFFIGLAIVAGLGLLYYAYMIGGGTALLRMLRWVLGGLAAAGAALLIFGGRIGIGSILAVLAYSILVHGRVGRWSLKPAALSGENVSEVRSTYFRMALDHDSGRVAGKVTAGPYRGWDMDDLGEDETREILGVIQDDPDSLSLFETYLDANRAGWREYFEEKYGDAGAEDAQDANIATEKQALDILGLKSGASEPEIRAAHRRLIKAVHPDQGGSAELAARINQAKDLLLKKS
jgi:hypothetical protein